MTEGTTRISRREALIIGGGVVAAAMLGVADAHAQESQPTPKPAFEPKPVAPFVERVLLFSQTYNASEKERFKVFVNEQEAYIVESKYHGVGETERMQEFKKIGDDYKGVIDSVVSGEGIVLDDGLKNSLLGMILIESKGNPNEVSTGAVGLCQITSKTLEEVAKVEPTIWDRNMYAPKDNIYVAAKYLEILTKRYDKPELALWAYHLGEGTLWRGVKEHLSTYIKREDLETEIGALPETDQNAPIIAKYAQYLTIPSLMDSPAMQAVLQNRYSGTAYEGARTYVPRIVAASALIDKAV